MATVDTSFLDAWNPTNSMQGGTGGGNTVNGFFDILDNGLGAWVELEKIKAGAQSGGANSQSATRDAVTTTGQPVVDTSYLPQFTAGLQQGNPGSWLVVGGLFVAAYLLLK